MTTRTSRPRADDGPRSLADDLRRRDDVGLMDLLRVRPDLVSPVPNDVGLLATRATTRPSVQRALDRLDQFTLQTVDVLCALPDPTTRAAVDGLLGADAGGPLRTLGAQALVYGSDAALHLVRTVREVIGSPAGLGPPAEQALATYGPRRLSRLLDDLGLPPSGDPTTGAATIAAAISEPVTLERLIDDAGRDARAVLDRLAWGPPNGRVGDARRDLTVATARSPVERLLARGLLVATDPTTVVLPREVAVHLRGGRVHREARPEPPPAVTTGRDPAQVELAAGGSAFTALRLVEDLLEAWGLAPPPVLRAGGIGVRDLRRTATLLDVEEPTAALVIETAYVAGLLARSGEIEETWLPTPAYDVWRAHDAGRRWATLADGWLTTTRVAGLVGGRDERDRPLAALGPDIDRAAAPDVRLSVLRELAALPPGTAADGDSLRERIAWHRPRQAGGRSRADLVAWTLREAEVLGLTGRGALAAPARALLAGDAAAAATALEPSLPELVDHVLLQADLTAVAPGPLTTELGRELALLADVESTGGATVYRFSGSSVRRALDAGRSAAEVHRLLAAHSRTPVPQPLTYLVDDVARRHGRVRVGTATAYLRADDETVLGELVADRRTGQLRLRRIAPTVLTAQAPVDLVLERLRSMGYAPAAETPEGDLHVRRPDTRRAPARSRPPRLGGEPQPPAEPLLTAAVRALRAGDRSVRRVPASSAQGDGLDPVAGALPRSATADTLTALQDAAREGSPLWIGYVNADGGASQRVIEPLSVAGGQVSAFDHRRGEVRTFAVHRITGVAALEDDAH